MSRIVSRLFFALTYLCLAHPAQAQFFPSDDTSAIRSQDKIHRGKSEGASHLARPL
ncbi:MAG: hypothetical protein ACI8TQ_004094 [Planctomycetota bacterium]|jgi:hypothetical protein